MEKRMKRRPGERGAVVVVALGVLVALALMATAFLSAMSGPREASAQMVRQAHAEFAADAGKEHAIAVLESVWADPTVDYTAATSSLAVANANPGAYRWITEFNHFTSTTAIGPGTGSDQRPSQSALAITRLEDGAAGGYNGYFLGVTGTHGRDGQPMAEAHDFWAPALAHLNASGTVTRLRPATGPYSGSILLASSAAADGTDLGSANLNSDWSGGNLVRERKFNYPAYYDSGGTDTFADVDGETAFGRPKWIYYGFLDKELRWDPASLSTPVPRDREYAVRYAVSVVDLDGFPSRDEAQYTDYFLTDARPLATTAGAWIASAQNAAPVLANYVLAGAQTYTFSVPYYLRRPFNKRAAGTPTNPADAVEQTMASGAKQNVFFYDTHDPAEPAPANAWRWWTEDNTKTYFGGVDLDAAASLFVPVTDADAKIDPAQLANPRLALTVNRPVNSVMGNIRLKTPLVNLNTASKSEIKQTILRVEQAIRNRLDNGASMGVALTGVFDVDATTGLPDENCALELDKDLYVRSWTSLSLNGAETAFDAATDTYLDTFLDLVAGTDGNLTTGEGSDAANKLLKENRRKYWDFGDAASRSNFWTNVLNRPIGSLSITRPDGTTQTHRYSDKLAIMLAFMPCVTGASTEAGLYREKLAELFAELAVQTVFPAEPSMAGSTTYVMALDRTNLVWDGNVPSRYSAVLANTAVLSDGNSYPYLNRNANPDLAPAPPDLNGFLGGTQSDATVAGANSTFDLTCTLRLQTFLKSLLCEDSTATDMGAGFRRASPSDRVTLPSLFYIGKSRDYRVLVKGQLVKGRWHPGFTGAGVDTGNYAPFTYTAGAATETNDYGFLADEVVSEAMVDFVYRADTAAAAFPWLPSVAGDAFPTAAGARRGRLGRVEWERKLTPTNFVR